MQTYVNRNGDIYISTMPRALDDVPVAPQPFDGATYSFDKGRWVMPLEEVFKLLKQLRTGLLDLPVNVNVSAGEHSFFVSESASIQSKMNWMDAASGTIEWKTQLKTETGSSVFISLSHQDLSLVYDAIEAFSQRCFDYESMLTKEISGFISLGCQESEIERLSELLAGDPGIDIPEDLKSLMNKIVDILRVFSEQN